MATSTQERSLGTTEWRDHYDDTDHQLYEVDGTLMTGAEVAKSGLGRVVKLASSDVPAAHQAVHDTDSRVEAAAEVDTFNVIG